MSNDPLDLNQVAVFLKIAESRSLTAAAAALGQDKTRVSRVLASLEKRLDTVLVHRTTRQLRLTEEGARFYQKCLGPLREIQGAAEELVTAGPELRGRVRLTGAHGVGAKLLPPILCEFRRRHPGVTFQVIFAQASLDLTFENIDLALRIGAPKLRTLKMRKLGDLRSGLVATPDYVARAEAPLDTLSDLEKHPTFLLEAFASRALTFRSPDRELALTLANAVTCNSPDFLLDLSLQGAGVGFVPEFLAREALRDGRLVRLFDGWRVAPMPFSVYLPPRRHVPPHVRVFTEFLVEQVRARLELAAESTVGVWDAGCAVTRPEPLSHL